MGRNSKFDYSQFKKFVKNFESAQNDLESFLRGFLLQMAQRAIAQIKIRQRAVGAIDTGAMINMWGIGSERIAIRFNSGTEKYEIDPEKASIQDITLIDDALEVGIWNGMEYASHVEYGTKYMEGRFIMTVGLDKIQQQIPARFQKEFKRFLAERGAV